MKINHKGRFSTITVLAVLIAFFFGIVVHNVLIGLTEEPPFDPWGHFTIQEVDGTNALDLRIPGVVDVFDLSETESIHVTGTKCVNVDTPVQAGGVVNWLIVQPPGDEFKGPEFSGNSALLPGCNSSEFNNKIPDEFRESLEISLKTNDYVIVNIGGYTVPYKNGEEYGVRKNWTTENFAFVE